jgi:uncharacterized repeat protein (TIGR01451 family)
VFPVTTVARRANVRTTGGNRDRRWRVLALGLALSAIPSPAGAAPGDVAEISIDGSVSAPGVKVGHDLEYSLVMQNHGPGSASDVVLTVALDPDVTFGSVEAAPGICQGGAVIVCDLGSFEPTGQAVISILVTANASGTADASAAVEGDSIDLDQQNNASMLSAEVGAASSPCDLWGTGGPDRIRGTDRSDVICGRGGNDRLIGGRGGDRLVGGPGRDLLAGGDGDDVLIGGGGRDRMRGGPGADRCRRQGGDSLGSCS